MDTTVVIGNVRRRLKHLSGEQLDTRVGNNVPTVAEILRSLTGNESMNLTIESPLDGEKLYHLGQLVVILDLLTTREKRPMLVRWFD
ncbi:MAG: hypothetical protein J0H74_36735 [Chitinophagaceae bacterium]|nr:hypothetical protein [Chitinophagaceae bacterium]